MDAVLRLVFLGLLAGGSFAFVSWMQRRPGSAGGGVGPGVTVFTGPD